MLCVWSRNPLLIRSFVPTGAIQADQFGHPGRNPLLIRSFVPTVDEADIRAHVDDVAIPY